MLFLYRIVWYLVYSLAFPALGVLALAGSVKWRNRLGFGFDDVYREDGDQRPSQGALLWTHAASAGEVRALVVFVRAALVRDPELRFVVSVMTDVGYRTARELLERERAAGSVEVRFLPLDCSWPARNSLAHVNPDIFVFAETEIWPNWIAELNRRTTPVVIINGRISEKSFSDYSRRRSAIRVILDSYAMIIAQSARDAEKFVALGAPTERVSVAGNLKLDVNLTAPSSDERAKLRGRLGVGENEFLLIAGSVRPGEEEGIIATYRAVAQDCPRLRLALAPRHLERLGQTKNAVLKAGLTCELYSSGSSSSGAVTLIDEFGVLVENYGAADLAFVGGTMKPIGGHNILEPPQRGTPVLFGPFTENVSDAVEMIHSQKLGAQFAGWDEFERLLREALSGVTRFERMNEYSARHHADGPVARTLEALGTLAPLATLGQASPQHTKP
ncbi:MAG: 3-deoxy-D-manno-octulosonic acid transferase [Candidatus Zixiibacteriota bacterium]